MKADKGFIALISVIIISLILMLVATTLSFSAFFGRYNILDSEMKETSVYFAEACVDHVLVNLAKDSAYIRTNEDVVVGDSYCTIKSVEGGTTKVIAVQATYMEYVTNLVVEVDVTDLSLISWKEVAN